MSGLEFGVFIPIANNGWIVSRTAPQYMPTFDLNRRICQLAEEIGFDFAFSMCKWRGYDGATQFWNFSLDSVTLMAALAAVTKRIKVYCSIQPLLIPPPVAAKMIATIDDVSGGRAGVNIVTGAYTAESEQMGLLPPGYDGFRYQYAEEWIEIVKRLWTEPSVTHHGTHFHLDDCRSDPKPLSKPSPSIVCAGTSEDGMRFTARHGTHSFLGGRDLEEVAERSRRMKELAREAGRVVKTYTSLTLIQGETDAEASALLDLYRSGADEAALENIVHGMNQGASSNHVREMLRRFVFFGCQPLIGSPQTIATSLRWLAEEGGIDGVMLCFPDFIDGLGRFRAEVIPALTAQGISLQHIPAEA